MVEAAEPNDDDRPQLMLFIEDSAFPDYEAMDFPN